LVVLGFFANSATVSSELFQKIRRFIWILSFPITESRECIDEIQLRSSQSFEIAVDRGCAPTQLLSRLFVGNDPIVENVGVGCCKFSTIMAWRIAFRSPSSPSFPQKSMQSPALNARCIGDKGASQVSR
jgi:hypothetical protein